MLFERLQRPVRGVRVLMPDNSPFGAQIVPHRRLEVGEVERLLARMSAVEGPIVTSALTPIEQDAFLEAGFVEREALHLLRHSMLTVPPTSHPAMLRAGRRGDLDRVLAIDRESFDAFWALDRSTFTSARRATPVHRYRVATLKQHIVGYAITGRAGRSGFLQRLGVSTEVRGRGIGTQLVSDAIAWAISEGATTMLVNTQTVNETARRLYESLGFVLDREQLKVLEWHA